MSYIKLKNYQAYKEVENIIYNDKKSIITNTDDKVCR